MTDFVTNSFGQKFKVGDYVFTGARDGNSSKRTIAKVVEIKDTYFTYNPCFKYEFGRWQLSQTKRTYNGRVEEWCIIHNFTEPVKNE